MYRFDNCTFKDYAGQDNVQVTAAVQKIVKKVRINYSELRNVIFQSDDATLFAS